MDKERIKYVLRETEQLALPRILHRSIDLPVSADKVVVLTGIRRSGKTFILLDLMRRLLAEGVQRDQLVYLSFEDDRLHPIRPDELDLILRAHAELHPDLAGRPLFLLFDEVQNAPGWERYVRRLHDTRAGRLFVTGSSSTLLSREIATGLRGRCVTFEVFPLSFAEFVSFRGMHFEPYSAVSEARRLAALDEYLEIGGLPEMVLAEPALRPRILRDYVDLVFYRDLLERHRLANPMVLRELMRHCLASPATLVSPHRLYQDLRSRGLALGKDTLYRYLDHMEEAFLIYLLPVDDRSLRKRAMQPKKLHIVDWGLGGSQQVGQFTDRGRRLENAIFLHHRRLRNDLAYMQGPAEIDLVVGIDRPEVWISTAWSITEDAAWQREEASLRRDGGPAKRLLVVRETANRKPPPGCRIIDASAYLLSAMV